MLLAAAVARAAPAKPGLSPSELPAAAPAIIERALAGGSGEEDLRDLCLRIGGRLTGSPAADRAIEWAAGRMRAIGLENVHAEKFSLRRGWERGSASLETTFPVRRSLRVVSYGWTGSTPASGVDAEIVPVNLFRLDDEMKNAAAWKGRIVLTVERGEKPANWAPRAATLETLVRRALAAGAAGVALAPLAGAAGGMDLAHTTSLAFDGIDDIPVVSLTPEGHSAVERLLATRGKVRARLRVLNRVTAGPVESANVVGEIRGRERPREVVLAGAHLDSWDLAQGATDDGFGVAAVLQSARAILGTGIRPRRTLRFVLFTGEEQRFVGSIAYVRAHAAEMADLVAVFVLDDGPGPIDALHLGGRREAVDAARRLAGELSRFGRIAVDDEVEAGMDTLPFTLVGAAAVGIGQDSPAYARTHHSEADTIDAVDPAMIRRDSAVFAALAFWAADRPERLARPWPPAATAKLLGERGLEDGLRFYGLWPFEPGSPERGAAPR
ncbi:MAG TPA: M20/M25/M40 family metallo-hydrolase [Thermoanaerobaculia bacterium]|nr:M20/M25/M40 family metallo-hydrolase [Thermoanaerobaculia bacterium]